MNSGERLTINRDRAFTITADMIDSARFNYDNYCQTLYGQPINTITTSVWNIDEEEKVKLEKDNVCLRKKVEELEEENKGYKQEREKLFGTIHELQKVIKKQERELKKYDRKSVEK